MDERPSLGPIAFRTVCSVDGCDRPHFTRGLCSRHYSQARRSTPGGRERQRAYMNNWRRRRAEADPGWHEAEKARKRDRYHRGKAGRP